MGLRWPTPGDVAVGKRAYLLLFFAAAGFIPVLLLGHAYLLAAAFALAAAAAFGGWSYFCGLGEGYTMAKRHGDEDAAELASLPREVDRWWWAELPIAPEGQGCLYAIKFETGVVKVGQTNHPARRLAEHRRDAWAFNVVMAEVWVSTAHEGYLANEVRLIAFAASTAERARREYFHGADFEKIVQFGLQLAGPRDAALL